MTSLNRDTIVSIVLLVFCGVLIWAGFQIRDPQFGELPPAAWPQGVSYVLTGFSLIYFFQSITSGQPAAERQSIEGGLLGWLKSYINPIACFAIYFLFLITLPFFGTLIGGTLLVFTLLSVLGGVRPRQIAVHATIAIVSVGFMWSLFTFGLRVLLPRGEIMPGI